MARLTKTDVHVDAVLTSFAIGWEGQGFVADRCAPKIAVAKESDKFFIWDRGDAFRDVALPRADMTEAAISGMGLATDSYSTEEFAVKTPLGDRLLRNADAPLSLERAAAQYVKERLLIRREIDFTDTAFKTGVWGTSVALAGTDQWSDHTSGPLSDIAKGKEQIRRDIGRYPNRLILGPAVWEKLMLHPDLLKAAHQQGQSVVEPPALARAVGMEVLVGTAIKTTSNESATDVTADIFGKNAILLYVQDNPQLNTPTAAARFSVEDITVRRYREEKLRGDWVEASENYDTKIVAKVCGYAIIDAVA